MVRAWRATRSPLYDPLVRLETIRQRLVDQARIRPEMSVLDLGCGTGALVLLVKRSHPTARVVGLDVDPKILDIARHKITAVGADSSCAAAPSRRPASHRRPSTVS
ncbi:MAG: methyltransferase domain-containing protein [Streptosporangiales bacterium]|nr:methyltransferase domain-containing protein [Streptosporangiales bacterium]